MHKKGDWSMRMGGMEGGMEFDGIEEEMSYTSRCWV